MPLDQLPIELLLLVTNNLTTPEYSAVRLTCKAIKIATYEAWAQEFFSTRQFSLLPDSLSALLAISKHETLNRYLKRLIIGTDYIPAPIPRNEYLVEKHPKRSEELWKAQNHFWTTGWDQRFLADAVRNLPNLSSVEVRNFNSEFQGGRVRDDVAWRSYGWSTVEEARGRDDLPQDLVYAGLAPTLHYYCSVFQKVLAAAIECRELRAIVSHIRHIIGVDHTSAGISTRALWIAPSVQARYKDALQHLETFMFSIIPPDDNVEGGVEDVVQFLSLMPCLKHLRLNSTKSRSTYFVTSILQSCAPKLQELTKLELGTMRFEQSGLEQLHCFRTLGELSLFRIDLFSGTWKELLPTLVRTIPTLRSVTLMDLRQHVVADASTGASDSWMARVAFKAAADAHVDNILDPLLTSRLTVTDKRDTDLASALNKALNVIVVDDEKFRRAREVMDPDTSSEDDGVDDEEDVWEDGEDNGDSENDQADG